MAIAAFANKVFEVNTNKLYTFDDIQYSSSLQTEKQDSDGSKPSTYIKGPDLDTLEFKLSFDVLNGINPRREWEDWQGIMSSGKPYKFILGGKPLGKYLWLLTGVTPSDIKIDNSGNVLSLGLDIKLDEYVRAGSAKENSGSNSAPAISKAHNTNTTAKSGANKNKSDEKRKNSRMKR